jgi:hypothetical protein
LVRNLKPKVGTGLAFLVAFLRTKEGKVLHVRERSNERGQARMDQQLNLIAKTVIRL